MITSLSNNDKNIDAALNSLDVLRKMRRLTSQTKTTDNLSFGMAEDIMKHRESIETEIVVLKTALNSLESALHHWDDHSQDDKITQLREILNSFDPEGKITETDLSL